MASTTTDATPSTPSDRPTAARAARPPGAAPSRPGAWQSLRPLVLRLHFLAGLFVAPFILVAAVSGGLYAITPQVDRFVHGDLLAVDRVEDPLPLADQVAAATATQDSDDLVAVRPAPTAEGTTRVLFDDGTLGESTTRAVFVHPGTGEVLGTELTYGTSGALPVRTWVDLLHRQLHLGETGRLYSELAASWLWVVALGGLALRVDRAVRRRSARPLVVPQANGPRRARLRSWHGVLGIGLLVGLVALSATGLTWSRLAGAGITDLRAAAGWSTPALDRALPAAAGSGDGGGDAVVPQDDPDAASGAPGHEGHGSGAGHEGHGGDAAATGGDWGQVDDVVATARTADITAGLLEVEPPADAGAAWTVTEIDRGFPTQVDAVAVDPVAGQVVSETRFADYPFMAKMARWGVDLHTGSMFGLVNQLALLALAGGLVALVLLGYRMWWARRPARGPWWRTPAAPSRGSLRRLPLRALVPVLLVAAVLAWALPLLGASLLVFLAVDTALGLRHRTRRTPA